MQQLDSKPLFPKLPPLVPEKRAKAIREAIAKGKIKRSDVTDSILVLLDQMVALEETA
ncbi:MAG TPA: hypothetical protein VHV10_15645 [Ktedonobacteraceae bacterium]|nr:hypothetical protein [Ktedonobacteraceae bacterium]